MATSRRTYTWNAFESGLSSGIDGTTTSITLDSVVGLREPDGYLVLDPDDPSKREYIKYASIVGNALQGVTRGLAGGNTNQEHDAGSKARAVPMHQHYDDLWDTSEELIADDANHIAAANPHAAAGYITQAAGDARYLQLSGGGMTGPIDMQTSKIVNLGSPVGGADSDAATKKYVDDSVSGGIANYLPLAGGTMTGDIAMGGNSILNLPNPPTQPGEATRKDYVDATAAGAVDSHKVEASPHDAQYVPRDGGGGFDGDITINGEMAAVSTVSGARFLALNPGGVGTPIYSWFSEPTTGMYLPSAGDLRFTVLGNLSFRITNDFVAVASTRLQVPSLNDTALPGLYFGGDNDTGISHSANNLGFSTGGTERLRLVNSADHLINDGPLRAIYNDTVAPTAGDGVNGDIWCEV
jgi:hypothetical protein